MTPRTACATQVVRALLSAVIADTVRAFNSDWYLAIAEGMSQVKDGFVTPSDALGLGITLREDFLARPDPTRPDTITRTTRLA